MSETTSAVMEKMPKLGPRFVRKVEIKENGCWKWAAARGLDGFGRFGNNGGGRAKPKVVRANQYAYRQLVARYPAGFTLWPACGDRLCVNPAHQELIRQEEWDRRTAGQCRAGRHRLAEQGVDQVGRCVACNRERWDRLGLPHPPRGPAMADRERCPHGHEYSTANTVRYRGKRFCRECHRLACIEWRQKRKALSG